MNIHVQNYPQLAFLLWNRNVDEIDEREAFALYERNWKHVDQTQLTTEEQKLINQLIEKIGGGVFLV